MGTMFGTDVSQDDPVWGCGLLGKIPGISENGEALPETQRFIDALKLSSSLNKADVFFVSQGPFFKVRPRRRRQSPLHNLAQPPAQPHFSGGVLELEPRSGGSPHRGLPFHARGLGIRRGEQGLGAPGGHHELRGWPREAISGANGEHHDGHERARHPGKLHGQHVRQVRQAPWLELRDAAARAQLSIANACRATITQGPVMMLPETAMIARGRTLRCSVDIKQLEQTRLLLLAPPSRPSLSNPQQKV